jgi:hypothetical protein
MVVWILPRLPASRVISVRISPMVDFKIGRFDVNAGVGYGLTHGSDRLTRQPEPGRRAARVHMGARLTRIAPRANKRPNREATIEMASHT